MTYPKRPAIERFWTKVDRTDTCWLWTGATNYGYGLWTPDIPGPMWRVHRWAWEYFVGPIPEGLTIDHLCRVRNCVNPAHLEPVTMQENIARRPSPTHCPSGHLRSEDNLYVWRGIRYCRKCRAREAARQYRQRKAANRQ